MSTNLTSNITLHQGRQQFEKIVKEAALANSDWNEADTRLKFIDRLLIEVLGWPRTVIETETHLDGKYADYLLGKPCTVIWEAKRNGIHFDLPANFLKRTIVNLKSLCQSDKNINDAIIQVQQYCVSKGSEFAVICNGTQLIAFIAMRIGHPALEGKAIAGLFSSHLPPEF